MRLGSKHTDSSSPGTSGFPGSESSARGELLNPLVDGTTRCRLNVVPVSLREVVSNPEAVAAFKAVCNEMCIDIVKSLLLQVDQFKTLQLKLEEGEKARVQLKF